MIQKQQILTWHSFKGNYREENEKIEQGEEEFDPFLL